MRTQTKRYASKIIRLYTRLPTDRDDVRQFGEELVRSGMKITAIANHLSLPLAISKSCAAMDDLAEEIKESQRCIELLRDDCGIQSRQINSLHQEAGELVTQLLLAKTKWTDTRNVEKN